MKELAVEARLLLGSFSIDGFLSVHLANKITIDWSDTNIDSCVTYLEAVDGTRVLLNDNEPGVAKFRPTKDITKYASSSVQDYGAYVITDEGVDTIIDKGISATVMADPHLSYAFQMLKDRTATAIVFVLTPVNSALPMTIDQPLFEYTLSGSKTFIYENTNQVCLIHPEGSGTRFGNMNTGETTVIDNPPTVYLPTERPNSVDWRIQANLCLKGVAHDTDLTSDISVDRDSVEVATVQSERIGTYGFILPTPDEATKTFIAICDSLAQIPPLMMLPRRARNTTTWLETGDFSQHSWVFAQDYSYYINPLSKVDLVHLGNTWTSPVGSVTDWFITRHNHELTNDEVDSSIVNASEVYNTVRPFRGYYSVLPPEGFLPSSISYDISNSLIHTIASINEDGFIVIKYDSNAQVFTLISNISDIEASTVNIKFTRYEDSSPLFVWYTTEAPGTLFYVKTTDFLLSHTMPISIATSVNVYHDSCILHNIIYSVYIKGSDPYSIYCKAYTEDGTEVLPESEIISGVDLSAISVAGEQLDKDTYRLVVWYSTGNTLMYQQSLDGVNFS